jgi:hypothetical protein
MGRSKEVLRRKLAILGAAVTMAVMLVMAAAAVSALPATTETFSVSSPESFTINNPCPGYEEPILVEGVFHHVLRVTQVDRADTQPGTDIYTYTIRTNSTNVTGTGELSGDEYRFINPGGSVGGSFSTEVTPEGQGIAGQFTDELSYIIVSEGASPNFMYHETIKYVFPHDPDPEQPGPDPIVEIQNYRTTCTGDGQTAQPLP